MATKTTDRNNKINSKSTGTKKRVSKRKKRMRTWILIDVLVLLPLLLLYISLSFYYHNHFFRNTVVNGYNTSNMTVNEVEDVINSQVKSYRLQLIQRNGVTDTITGEYINLHTEFEGGMSDLLKKQNAFSWPLSLFESKELQIKTMITLDEDLLKYKFKKLNCFDEANNVEPTNATISEYGENGFEITPGNPGAKVNEEKLYEAIKNAVLSLEPTLSLEEAGCYEAANLSTEAPELLAALEKMNKIAGTKITYEFGEDTEVLDGEEISKWLSVDDEYQVHLDPAGVKEYVDYIGKTYNSFGKTRKFMTSYEKEVEVKGGDYGWWLDRATEVSQLTDLILNGEQQVRKPVYFQTAQQYGSDDIGDTYVEVNLTAQHLFFYKDGNLVVESDFVSGNLSKEFGTPTGTYPVQYKDLNATLVGEDYETPVKYWMPFNKNIGFHDANWRSKFGEDIYLTSGSHGCINMPPENAKTMYQNIERGVAVIVYELPGTESYEVEKEKPKKN
ncbi:MAG: ErfK/YbiS/YcfS/YnhG family protein [Herbinix sp.]|jgi:hypothetical protein|nr:ErfK/YbiS/YcfS/YnhG family protein [Herbinix sp.]